MRRARRRPPLVVAPAVLLVVAVVLATALAGPWNAKGRPAGSWLVPAGMPTFSAPTQAETAAGGSEPAATLAPPVWVGTALQVLALVVVAGLVALVVRAGVRRLLAWWRGLDREEATTAPVTGGEDRSPLDEAATTALVAGLVGAERALTREPASGDAVIASWLELEAAAAGCGVERDRVQTASEFTLALLDRTAADPQAARRLLARYHAARFSTHPATPEDVAVARAALATLAATLVGRGDPARIDEAATPDDGGGAAAPQQAPR